MNNLVIAIVSFHELIGETDIVFLGQLKAVALCLIASSPELNQLCNEVFSEWLHGLNGFVPYLFVLLLYVLKQLNNHIPFGW